MGGLRLQQRDSQPGCRDAPEMPPCPWEPVGWWTYSFVLSQVSSFLPCRIIQPSGVEHGPHRVGSSLLGRGDVHTGAGSPPATSIAKARSQLVK